MDFPHEALIVLIGSVMDAEVSAGTGAGDRQRRACDPAQQLQVQAVRYTCEDDGHLCEPAWALDYAVFYVWLGGLGQHES